MHAQKSACSLPIDKYPMRFMQCIYRDLCAIGER